MTSQGISAYDTLKYHETVLVQVGQQRNNINALINNYIRAFLLLFLFPEDMKMWNFVEAAFSNLNFNQKINSMV